MYEHLYPFGGPVIFHINLYMKVRTEYVLEEKLLLCSTLGVLIIFWCFYRRGVRNTPTTFDCCFFSFQRKAVISVCVFQCLTRSSDLKREWRRSALYRPKLRLPLEIYYHSRNCIVACLLCFRAVLVRLRRVRGVPRGDRSRRSTVPAGHTSETLIPYRFVPYHTIPYTFTPSVR